MAGGCEADIGKQDERCANDGSKICWVWPLPTGARKMSFVPMERTTAKIIGQSRSLAWKRRWPWQWQ